MSFSQGMSLSQVVHFERMCRLCLHEKRILMEIFDSTEEKYSLTIYEKIKACATVNLCRGDGLPTKICIPCLSSLNAAFEFRVQCENSDKALHNICHVLVSDEVKNKKALKMVHDTEKTEVECDEAQPEQLELIDLNQIIVIKEPDKDITRQKDKHHRNETKNVLNVIDILKENEEGSDKDDLISINVEDISSYYSLGFLPFQGKEITKLNKVSFPVRKNCVDEAPGVTSGTNSAINAGGCEKKTKRKTIRDVQKSECPFCHKMLTRVNEHIRLLHQNKVYICKKQNCGAEFLTLKNLQSHQLKCYNMEKPYKCLRCFKEFHRKCNYKAHIIRHSNKKDFQCQLCDKAFVDSTGLKRHFLKHHEPQKETFISGCCEKTFKTKEGLKQHIQRGTCGLQIFQVLDSCNET